MRTMARGIGTPSRLRFIVSVLVLTCVGSPARAQSGSDEIEQVIKAFLVPFSNQNVSEFMDYFAEDATVFFPQARFPVVRVEGKAAIASAFATVFKPSGPAPATNRPLIQPQDLKVQRFGDSAVVTFHLGSDTTRGRRTFVLRRIDSTWRIVHLHASTITP
jgi:ketosteroid isomerase-like protein